MSRNSSDSEMSTSSTPVRSKAKRANHNELERKRRHHQKLKLLELRDAIPTLRLEKPSTVLILQKAKEYIEILKKKVNEVEFENDGLRKALLAGGAPSALPPPADNRMYHSPAYRQVDYDPKEAALLSPYERKLSANRLPLDNGGELKHDMYYSPPVAHPFETGQHGMSFSQNNDTTNLFRKRKSAVDNDFEAVKRAFYSRRESGLSALDYMRDPFTPRGGEAPYYYPMQYDTKRPSVSAGLVGLAPSATGTSSGEHGYESFGQEEVKCRACMGGLGDLPMLDCDKCHGWYHMHCVSIDSNNVPHSWLCNDCASSEGQR